MDLPLAGIRVLDLTRALSGPYCTMLLGDHGADIVKIEKPGRGDDTRHQGNPRLGDENSAFLAVNRNKKSVTVDLRTPQGVDIIRRLATESDVVVENFRPGTTDRMGIGWEDLKKINPRLVYCSISGWGGDGPYAARGGYASTAEAAAGLMSVTGERGGAPVKVGVSIIDTLTGLFAKDAVTSALLAREKSGEGQKVEVSLLESTVSILTMTAAAYLMGGVVAEAWGSEHEWNVPWKTYKTSDGYLVIASSSEQQWVKICAGMGREDLIDDERFASMAARLANRDELNELMDGILATRPTAEWERIFDETGAAVAPVNRIDQVFKDPQVLHRQMLQSVEHQTLGEIPQVGHAQKYFGSPLRIELPPPVLGAHTEEVLGTLGYSSEEIATLREANAI